MTTTDVSGDVNGPVQSGSFNGPVQTVTITLPSPDEPPEPTIREQIRSIRFAVLSLNQMFVSDREERKDRQRSTDWHIRIVMALSGFAASGVLLIGARLMGWW